MVLHGPGIYVQVPTPERYAVHKIILALDRPVGIGKRDKDLSQAKRLIEVLVERRPMHNAATSRPYASVAGAR